MAFFSDKRGVMRQVADIERISEGVYWGDPANHRPAKVYMKDGDEWGVEIDHYVLKQITRDASSVVSANPGFETVTYWYQSESPDEPYVEHQPVLAWRVSNEYGPEPIVLDESSIEPEQIWGILYPSGEVVTNDTARYVDLDDWKRAAKHEAMKQQNAKSAQT